MEFGIITPILAGLGKNVIGWLENALKDGKIESYEWGQLFATILQVGVISTAIYYGLNTDWVTASAGGVLASFGLTAIKKAGTQ